MVAGAGVGLVWSQGTAATAGHGWVRATQLASCTHQLHSAAAAQLTQLVARAGQRPGQLAGLEEAWQLPVRPAHSHSGLLEQAARLPYW